MNKKVQKGEYGYRSALRKEQVIKDRMGDAIEKIPDPFRSSNGQCGVSHACRMEMEDSVRGFPQGSGSL